jgi:hypothetical protein
MKLHIEHTFHGISPADYETLYFDEEFGVALCQAVKLGREVLKFEKTGDRIVRHVRVTPQRDVPGAIKKVLGEKPFSYVEEVEFEVGKLRGRWKTVPSIVPDKVLTGGTLVFEPVSGGVKRVVDGEIKVNVFGIGGIVEKFVVGEVEKSYGDAAVFTQQWVDKSKK